MFCRCILSSTLSMDGRSSALRAYVDGLGLLLGPLLAVLGRSWALCWRSWAALRASVDDLGPLLGPMLAVLGALGSKSGPGPSGKAIWV